MDIFPEDLTDRIKADLAKEHRAFYYIAERGSGLLKCALVCDQCYPRVDQKQYVYVGTERAEAAVICGVCGYLQEASIRVRLFHSTSHNEQVILLGCLVPPAPYRSGLYLACSPWGLVFTVDGLFLENEQSTWITTALYKEIMRRRALELNANARQEVQ